MIEEYGQVALKKKLRALVDNPSWAAVEQMKQWAIEVWEKESVFGETMDQIAIAALRKESKIQAINEFFEKLERMAHDNDHRAESSND